MCPSPVRDIAAIYIKETIMMLLEIKNLHCKTGEKEILHGVSFTVNEGSVTALMGPNGSGKSTLASVLMGHPDYEVTEGGVVYAGEDLLALKPEERARKGLFLSFQYPQSIAGVSIGNFLRIAYNSTRTKEEQISVKDFLKMLKAKMELLEMPKEFMSRSVNEGFSGGEKKRCEMLQLAVLQPRLAILDETDSGLDVDALSVVGKCVNAMRTENSQMSFLVITHYQRLLEYIPADGVVVMRTGKVVAEGSGEILAKIEKEGFKQL